MGEFGRVRDQKLNPTELASEDTISNSPQSNDSIFTGWV